MPAKTDSFMPIIEEKNNEGKGLAFYFPSDWQVVKYDQEADSAANIPAGFYRRVILSEGVQQVRGMDIVCRLPGKPKQLEFIEIKDERERDPETNVALRHDELRKTVLRKTLDTLAGLLLAERLNEDSLRPMACLSQHPEIRVILFLVEPLPIPIPPRRNKKLRKLTKQQVRTGIDQQLNAKLDKWGISFQLYNLNDRPPKHWYVRDLA